MTLGCFPAITVFAKSSSPESEWGTKYFIPVCCFVLFNVGDWLGRFSAEMIQWPKPGRFGMFFVLALTLLRIGKYSIDAVGSSRILIGKQKIGLTFNSDKLGGNDFTKFSKLTMCSA